MRAFIILALIAVVRANAVGYNYDAGSAGGGSISDGGAGINGGGSLGDTSYGSNGGGDAGIGVGPVGGGGGSNGGGVNSFGISHAGGSGNAGHVHNAPSHTDFTKEFYTFTAPESEFEDGETLNDLSSSLKKSLRVIFIRGPENHGLTDAALNLAKSSVDSKTAIYVLNKQNDISHLAQQLQNLKQNSHSHTPEVHFVKYRTPEDAAHAQHAIQQQYDNLGGTSQSHDGGVAPVLNFASQAPHGSSGGVSHGSVDGGHGAVAPSAAYLPIRL